MYSYNTYIYIYIYVYIYIYIETDCLGQTENASASRVTTAGLCAGPCTPSTRARQGSWLLEALAAAGVRGTKVHKAQAEWPEGKRAAVLPPSSGVCQRWALTNVLLLHTACGRPIGGRVMGPWG